MEAYEDLVSLLIGQLEILQVEHAIICSEWDAFFREIQGCYTSVEAIGKCVELNIMQATVLDEISKVKRWLRNATARELNVNFNGLFIICMVYFL